MKLNYFRMILLPLILVTLVVSDFDILIFKISKSILLDYYKIISMFIIVGKNYFLYKPIMSPKSIGLSFYLFD